MNNKYILGIILGTAIVVVNIFAESAKANIKPYIGIQVGSNFGHSTIIPEEHNLISGRYKISGTATNINAEAGAYFERSESPGQNVLIAGGLNLGLNAGITKGGRLVHLNIVDDDTSLYHDYELGNDSSYNLLFVASVDIIKIKNYKIAVVGGAGFALNQWYGEHTIQGTDNTEPSITVNDTFSCHQSHFSFISKAGIKQELFITNSISLSLELDYSFLGKYNATIKPHNIDLKDGSHYNADPGIKVNNNLGSRFTANFGLTIYL